MTEYRALTEGGCIAGSVTINTDASIDFVPGPGVRVVQLEDRSYNYFYCSCVPGQTYHIYRDSSGRDLYVNNISGHRFVVKSGTLSWSSDINHQACAYDLGNPPVTEE